MEAEGEGGGYEMAVKQVFTWLKTIYRHPVSLHARGGWEIIASIAPHTGASAMLFEPLVRQPFLERIFIDGPGVFLAVIEESCFPLVVQLVIQFARDELSILQAHTIVLLAAFTAKYKRQEHPVAITRYVLLSLQRQVTFLFKRGKDRIAFADELVQAEGERWSACFWMRLTCIYSKQCLLDSLNTALDRLISELTQSIGSTSLT